ncbi:hypothetical protein BD410DRAFT_744038 [Rickenella mellea]|uniref:F-box domain-containing protein n=1 Tax=Rickenella mellea TaxID=50990 RepID=A0A4Y7QC90_9AGAM|nr:hypothetical protein BD410DRAFT_744038 [Rickenella mellea]
MEQVLSILLPHLPRWQYLDLHADTWEPIFCFLYHTQKRCAPLLQHVSMARCYTYFSLPGKSFLPQPMKRHFPLFGGGTPKLRRITLTGVHVEWTSMAFRNLTELDLRYHARDVMPTVPEFIRMLSTPQLLQKLAIVGWGTRWCDEMWEGNVVVLPHLLDLHLGFFDPLHASHLLTLMKMNSLTSIVLEEMSRNVDKFIMPTTDATPVLSHFIHYAHRFHGVERMHLRMIHCMPEYFAHFLEVFSSLRDLTLDGVPEPFLNALTSRPHEYGVVCPQLRFVRCRGLSDDAIRNFIRSRANSHHPLRSVNSEVGVSCETSTVCEVIGKTGLSIVPVD